MTEEAPDLEAYKCCENCINWEVPMHASPCAQCKNMDGWRGRRMIICEATACIYCVPGLEEETICNRDAIVISDILVCDSYEERES